jgi:hypothetical protein
VVGLLGTALFDHPAPNQSLWTEANASPPACLMEPIAQRASEMGSSWKLQRISDQSFVGSPTQWK